MYFLSTTLSPVGPDTDSGPKLSPSEETSLIRTDFILVLYKCSFLYEVDPGVPIFPYNFNRSMITYQGLSSVVENYSSTKS